MYWEKNDDVMRIIFSFIWDVLFGPKLTNWAKESGFSPLNEICFCSFYSARENALNIHWEAAIKFPSVSNCAKSLFIK